MNEKTLPLLLRILKYLKPNKKKLTLVVIGIVITTVTGFFQPLVVKMITDDGLINQDMQVILIAVVILLGLVLVDGLIEVGMSSLFADIHNESEMRMYSQAFSKLLRLKAGYFTDKNSAEVINSMSTDVSMVSSLTDRYNVMIISFVFKIFSGIAGLLVISPLLTLVVIAMVPVKYLTVKRLSKIREKRTEAYIDKIRGFSAWMSDTISGVKEIKLWNLFKPKTEEFTEKESELLIDAKKFTMIDAWNMFVEVFLTWIVSALLYVFGGMLLINGSLTIGGLFAFISYSSYVTSPISVVLNMKMVFARIIPSAKRLFKFLELDEENEGGETNIHAGDIIFEDVKFSYENREILKGLNMTIPKGSKTAIIGANGSGKSTVINLILRFLEPDEGEIKLGGQSINEVNLEEYRILFSVVSQNPYLFSKNVRENIDLDNTSDDEKLTYVYQKSGVAAYLEKLPNGEMSLIGSNGARLSGGEKQKLAVARALMKDTPYVILDEATSGFDVESDAYLHDVIVNEMRDKTVILITHRYENLEGLDCVFELKDGRVGKKSGKG